MLEYIWILASMPLSLPISLLLSEDMTYAQVCSKSTIEFSSATE